MDELRVSLFQYDIVWESKSDNFRKISGKLKSYKGKTDLVVFPEMFSTGFSMNPAVLAETMCGETMSFLRRESAEGGFALAGSFIYTENGCYYNRGFFVEPDGRVSVYDKRHLFRMGDETKFYSGGNKHLLVNYRGWNISLLVCYDLRFPVWARNVDNHYDLLIYVANWPAPRIQVWDLLLRARAVENMAFVCGVNRTGTDGMQLNYTGSSQCVDARGKVLLHLPDNEETMDTCTLSLASLRDFRQKFPVWKDADRFTLSAE